MYSEFAYSGEMQIILAIITYIETFISMYVLSNVIMTTFKIKQGRRQKILFTLINGSLLQTTFVYAVYILGGHVSFSPIVYAIVVSVNPLAAMVYYYSALKIFKLSSERSVKLMSYILIFWSMKVTVGRLIHAARYIDPSLRYNYLMDATNQLITLSLFLLINYIMLHALSKTQISLKFFDNMVFNKRTDLIFYIFEAVFLFAVSVIVPFAVTDQVSANVIVVLIILLFTLSSICIDIFNYSNQVISNRDIHIGALFRGMEELRGVKHDFNNILHTYSGYLELKEYDKLERYHASLVAATSHAGSTTELAQKMQENPQLISLLISKLDYAERMSVKLIISLKCSLNDLYIDNTDISLILADLLDSAIETANGSEQRKVYLTIESKQTDSKLIIAAYNSTYTDLRNRFSYSKDAEVRRQRIRGFLNKYGNCSYQTDYRDKEISTYIELRRA